MNIDTLIDEFSGRWLAKAESYDRSGINGAVDAFWTTFVVYNALYARATEMLHDDGVAVDDRDAPSATMNAAAFIGHQTLAARLKRDFPGQVATVRDVVVNATFFIHTNRKTHQADYEKDQACIRQLELGSDQEFCEAILMLIYQVRCNLFHGRKEVSASQLVLLNAMSEILQDVVAQLRTALAVKARHP